MFDPAVRGQQPAGRLRPVHVAATGGEPSGAPRRSCTSRRPRRRAPSAPSRAARRGTRASGRRRRARRSPPRGRLSTSAAPSSSPRHDTSTQPSKKPRNDVLSPRGRHALRPARERARWSRRPRPRMPARLPLRLARDDHGHGRADPAPRARRAGRTLEHPPGLLGRRGSLLDARREARVLERVERIVGLTRRATSGTAARGGPVETTHRDAAQGAAAASRRPGRVSATCQAGTSSDGP